MSDMAIFANALVIKITSGTFLPFLFLKSQLLLKQMPWNSFFHFLSMEKVIEIEIDTVSNAILIPGLPFSATDLSAPGEVAAARRFGAEHSAGRRDGGAGDPGERRRG